MLYNIKWVYLRYLNLHLANIQRVIYKDATP